MRAPGYTHAVREMPSVAEAGELAQELLLPLANRWAHVQAVAARADGLTPAITGEDDRRLLVVAAWWHDLGYAPALRDTGSHQIDGARYLAREGYPERLCALVAQSFGGYLRGDRARPLVGAGGVAAGRVGGSGRTLDGRHVLCLVQPGGIVQIDGPFA